LEAITQVLPDVGDILRARDLLHETTKWLPNVFIYNIRATKEF